VQQHPDSGGRRNNIAQQPQALLGKLGGEDVDPGRIAAGPGKAGYEPEPDRIGAGVEYDWDSCGRLLSRRSGCFAADRDDNGDPAGYEVGRQGWHPVVAPLCPAILDDDVAPHLEPHLLQTATEAFVEVQPERRRGSGKKANDRQLLRACRERPRGCATEQRDERAPLHSITSSASCCRCNGTSRPSALAVCMLMTNSNLVDCKTGRSAGLAPLRI